MHPGEPAGGARLVMQGGVPGLQGRASRRGLRGRVRDADRLHAVAPAHARRRRRLLRPGRRPGAVQGAEGGLPGGCHTHAAPLDHPSLIIAPQQSSQSRPLLQPQVAVLHPPQPALPSTGSWAAGYVTPPTFPRPSGAARHACTVPDCRFGRKRAQQQLNCMPPAARRIHTGA